jgi:hypothetical protein
MARIRSIKPEFWKSQAIAEHDFFTRLVFIGLWTYVDDNGVGIDHYRLIAAELFPLEEDLASVARDVRESIARLAAAGRVIRYTVNGKQFLYIVNWTEHQKIDRPNKPRYPSPDSPLAEPTPPTGGNTPPRETLDEPSRESRATPPSGAGDQRNRGSEEQRKGSAPLALRTAGAAAQLRLVDDEPDEPVLTGEVVPSDPEPENAGQLTRAWIDFCKDRGVPIPPNHIKRYGGAIKKALARNEPVEVIKRALGEMLSDRVVHRPTLLDNYILRVHQGPELPPRRLTPGEASAVRMSPPGTDIAADIHDILTRPA